MDSQQREAKQRELAELQARAEALQVELSAADAAWRPQGYYAAYYATTGFMLGAFGAAASLLLNIVGSLVVGQHPLRLIQIYLTFPLGEQALAEDMQSGLTLAIGCCLYLGTGMLLGVPFYLAMTRMIQGDANATLAKRLLIATAFALVIWVFNFYVVLAWLQPLLFGGNWIVEQIPPAIACLTHLVFGWTMAMVYRWGLYEPYRLQTEA